MPWCGYIDMLGTREMAKRSSEELIRNLDYFHNSMAESFKYFENGRCSAFSDGAFFVSVQANDFHTFYARLRNMMFQRSLFFRCSYIPGDIPMLDTGLDEHGKYKGASPPAFRSFTFSGSAPEAYQQESDFKGIGCIIGGTASNRPQRTLDSFHVRLDGTKVVPVRHTDFAFSPYELSDPSLQQSERGFEKPGYLNEQPIVESVVLACHAALTQSDKVGSLFLSFFVTALRSSSLKLVEYDREQKAWIKTPYLFREIIGGGITKALRDLPGIHLLLLACFEKLYADFDGSVPLPVKHKVLERLSRHPACFRNLDRVPSFVISANARQELVKLRAEESLKKETA